MKVIPLEGGSVNAHQRFDVQLGDNLVAFVVNYLQSGQWAVDLRIGEELIVAGLMLEPGCDILATHPVAAKRIGALVFTGEVTTLDNLGAANRLAWVAPA